MKPSLPLRRSLVDEVARVLREQVSGGRWADVLPGEHALCAELGVSRMTLRGALQQLARQGWLALGGHGRRHRVAETARLQRPAGGAWGPPNQIRLLSGLPRDRVVGVMQAALNRLQADLDREGYPLQFSLLHLPPGPRGLADLQTMAAEPGVAGWVLYCASEPVQRWFAQQRLPCLVLGACFPGVRLPSVEFDARAIGRHAAHEFLRRGHTRIALVRPSVVLAGDAQCAAGLREGVARHPGGAEVIDLPYDPTPAGIRRAMDRTLARPGAPTAFLVAQPNFVWPVLGCLQRAGRRVPAEAAVLSRGDDLFLETSVPEVARYRHDGVRLGAAAARALLSLLKSARPRRRSGLLMPEFLPGETLGQARPRSLSAK
ncbi:MAG: hypothetical protein RJA22_703 [Verrucomicrobiota bacterium]